MDTIWAFVSSLFYGIGAALALTVVVALLLHYVARASWMVNALLSLLLLVLSAFQFVLLFGASTVKDYAMTALAGIDVAGQMADMEGLQDLVEEVPEIADYVEAGRQKLDDGSFTLHQLVDKLIGAYMVRRWLWLALFTVATLVAGFLLPSRRRRRRSLPADFSSPYGGGGGYSSSSSSSLNF